MADETTTTTTVAPTTTTTSTTTTSTTSTSTTTTTQPPFLPEDPDTQFEYDVAEPDVFLGRPEERIRDFNVWAYRQATINSTQGLKVNAGTGRIEVDSAGNLYVSGNITTPGNITADGVISAESASFSTNITVTNQVTAYRGQFNIVSATSKLFDIPHPSPGKSDKRLIHGAPEGPELAVYVRGVCSGYTIMLPDYWYDLIDPSTITVHLTATDPSQKLWVTGAGSTSISVEGSNGYRYFYYVMAERKDIPKLQVEQDA